MNTKKQSNTFVISISIAVAILFFIFASIFLLIKRDSSESEFKEENACYVDSILVDQRTKDILFYVMEFPQEQKNVYYINRGAEENIDQSVFSTIVNSRVTISIDKRNSILKIKDDGIVLYNR